MTPLCNYAASQIAGSHCKVYVRLVEIFLVKKSYHVGSQKCPLWFGCTLFFLTVVIFTTESLIVWNMDRVFILASRGRLSGFKKKSDHMLAYEKMTILLIWFFYLITLPHSFLMSLWSQSPVSGLLQYSIILILLIMIPFRVKKDNRAGFALGRGYLVICRCSQSDPISFSLSSK